MRAVVGLMGAAVAAASLAASGAARLVQLDPTFGSGGLVVTDASGGLDVGVAGAVQPDGKLLVAGIGFVPGAGGRAAIVRYLPSGLPDPSFGADGIVLSSLTGAPSTQAVAVAALPGGNIVVAVRAFSGGNFTWGVVRYHSDGTRDPTFGSNGETQITFGPGFDVLNAMAVTPAGKIVLAGGTNSGSNAAFVLARLNADGSVDTGFGQSGRVRTPFSGFFAIITDAKLQPDGRLVVGGMHGAPLREKWVYARYLADGTLDQTFGTDGIVAFDFGTAAAEPAAFVFTPGGKILGVGSVVLDDATFQLGFAAARLEADGSLDASFGVGGKTVGPGGFLSAVVVEADGSAIAAGASHGENRDFLIAQFDPDGRLGAVTRTDFGTVGDGAADLLRVGDGRYVAVGSTNDFRGRGDFALAAYVGADATPPHVEPNVVGTTGEGGWYVSDVDVSWSVSDAESAVTQTSGCESRTVNADIASLTLTCTATSEGGTTTASVTIRRDATAPEVRCHATPDVLWPPTHALRPIEIAVTVEDAGSGPRGFVLASASAGEGDPAEDIEGWTIGQADTSGLVRGERAGDAGARIYRFAYRGFDGAGNVGQCEATVTVPHDLRP